MKVATIQADLINVNINPTQLPMKKIAIQVSNKQEFEALMKHYESKGWKWNTCKMPSEIDFDEIESGNKLIQYKDLFSHNLVNNGYGYEIIPFPTFSAFTGVVAEVEPLEINQNRFLIKVSKYGAEIKVQDGDNGIWTIDSKNSSISLSEKTIAAIHAEFQELNK